MTARTGCPSLRDAIVDAEESGLDEPTVDDAKCGQPLDGLPVGRRQGFAGPVLSDGAAGVGPDRNPVAHLDGLLDIDVANAVYGKANSYSNWKLALAECYSLLGFITQMAVVLFRFVTAPFLFCDNLR